jgi:hypothetical protein
MSEWISVKDRMPEPRIDVLMYGGFYGIRVGWWDKTVLFKNIQWLTYGNDEELLTTHWMSLPNPPKVAE